MTSGGRSVFSRVAASIAAVVFIVAGYWVAFVAYVPTPVREVVALQWGTEQNRSGLFQRVVGARVAPGMRIDDAERWLTSVGLESHCDANPCEPYLRRYYYDAPVVFWPMVVSNNWSVLIAVDEQHKVSTVRCSVSVTAGLW